MTSISRETRRVAGSGDGLPSRDSDGSAPSIRDVHPSETEIRAEVPRLEGGENTKLYSMHVWEIGKPWWSEAYRVLDGKELAQAKLV